MTFNLFEECPKCGKSDFLERTGKVGYLPEHKFTRQICQNSKCNWVSEKIFATPRKSVKDIEHEKKEINDESDK